MNTIYCFELFDLTLHADTIETVMQGMFLIGLEYDGLLFLIESQHLHDDPLPFGELLDFFTLRVEEVEVVIAVFLTLHHKLVVVPRQKLDRVQRFYVFVAGLAIQLSHFLACDSIV